MVSAAAGLNAHILLHRRCSRDSPTSSPAREPPGRIHLAIAIAVLLVSEVVPDKIPAIDTINDTVQTFIRPSMAEADFAATTAASAT